MVGGASEEHARQEDIKNREREDIENRERERFREREDLLEFRVQSRKLVIESLFVQ